MRFVGSRSLCDGFFVSPQKTVAELPIDEEHATQRLQVLSKPFQVRRFGLDVDPGSRNS